MSQSVNKWPQKGKQMRAQDRWPALGDAEKASNWRVAEKLTASLTRAMSLLTLNIVLAPTRIAFFI